MEPYQVYYLLSMGEIESIKLGKAWRLVPEMVEDYDKQHPLKKNRNLTRHFIYQGDGGFLFRSLPDHLPPDHKGKSSGIQEDGASTGSISSPIVPGTRTGKRISFRITSILLSLINTDYPFYYEH